MTGQNVNQGSQNSSNSNPLAFVYSLFNNNPLLVMLGLFVFGIFLALLSNFLPIFPSLKFKQQIDVAGLFWGVATTLVIIERSIELFIAAWRNPRKEQLEQEIAIFKEQTLQTLSDEQKNKIKELQKEIAELEKNILENYSKIKTNEIELINSYNELEQSRKDLIALPANATEEERNGKQTKVNELTAKIGTLIEKERGFVKQNKELYAKILSSSESFNATNSSAENLKQKLKELGQYKEQTAIWSLILGLGLGLMASLVGIRILEPLVDVSVIQAQIKPLHDLQDQINSLIGQISVAQESAKPALTSQLQELQAKLPPLQSKLGPVQSQLSHFQQFDIFMSAFAIAGGVNLFHELPALIGDTLSSTRGAVKQSSATGAVNGSGK